MNPPTLTVNAASSDSLIPPTLTISELNQPLTAGAVALTEVSTGMPITPPGAITVVSSAGGSATRLVEVVNSDLDGDGVPNDQDNCPVIANADQLDGDSDSVGDACDNCTAVANTDQRDTNGDGYGNICDADLDDRNGVTTADFAIFRTAYGTNDPHADFDGLNGVTTADFAIFRTLYGKAPGPSCCAPQQQ